MLQKVAGSGTPHVWISLPARRGLRFQLVSGSAVFAPQQHYAPAERPSDNHGASWQPISEAGPVCRRTGKVGEMLAIPLYLYVVLAFSAFSSSSSSSLFAFLPSCFKLDALAMICDLIWVSLPGFSRNFVPTWSWLPNLHYLRLPQFCSHLIWFFELFLPRTASPFPDLLKAFWSGTYTYCTTYGHVMYHKWQLPPSFRESRELRAMGRLMSIMLTASSWRRLGNGQTYLKWIEFWGCSPIAMLCMFIPDRTASFESLDEGGACNLSKSTTAMIPDTGNSFCACPRAALGEGFGQGLWESGRP